MTAPVKITAILTVRPGKVDELEALLATLAAQSRAEPGNLRWDIWRDASDPRRFLLDELYRDEAATDAHRRSTHFRDYAERIGDLADRLAITAHPVDIASSRENGPDASSGEGRVVAD